MQSKRWSILALCSCLASGCAASTDAYVASYPNMVQYSEDNYEDWMDDQARFQDQYEGYREGLDVLDRKLLVAFMKNNFENRTISPLNLTLALGMLAQSSSGETQKQVLDLLGVDQNDLSKKMKALWLANYEDDGTITCKLNNSLWLSDRETYYTKLLELLKNDYYASAYIGDMQSPAFAKKMRDWIDQNTGDLLTNSTKDLDFDPQQVMSMISTLYFKGAWLDPFDASLTSDSFFHGKKDQNVPFMSQTLTTSYVNSEAYEAIGLPIENGGVFWLVLPKDSLSSLWESESKPEEEMAIVHLAMPKFDVERMLSLKETLQYLGVKDAFDPNTADFSPLTDASVYVDDVSHGVRVKVDEEGVEAAAFTKLDFETTALIQKEVDFVLDRPFAYVLQSKDGSMLLAGQITEIETK